MLGKTISHYRILEKLSEGGMGEVYRASDSKLGRDVAIKVLPEAFARDAERLARFEREAHLLASLNHPHIAAVYGLEEAGDTRCLVLELVGGETLAERLKPGPFPFEEAFDLAVQIAEALESAHERGIIHRDLKPGNIKVTPEGSVKVLDFGLAKAFEGDASEENLSNSPTLSVAPTQGGVILGTAAYMSPEQARGKRVDKRCDIWAFGCVLYEMLTGRKAFTGDTVTDILAAVITAQPDWEAMPPDTPITVAKLLKRCLEKDPKLRLRDIGDARLEIEEARRGLGKEVRTTPTTRIAAPRHVVPWSLAALMAMIACAAVWLLVRSPGQVPRPSAHFVVVPERNEPLAVAADPWHAPAVALSPDGTRLVYAARHEGTAQFYLRPMAQFEATPISGTEGAACPFFSPDGQWVGFFAGGRLKKVPVTGGTALTLCEAPEALGATWSADNTIWFNPDWRMGLSRVSASGGQPEVVTAPDRERGEFDHCWPEVLPGGKALLFTIKTGSSFQGARIAVLSLETRRWQTLVEGGSNPHYLPTGHIIYAHEATLLAVPFDLARLAVTGPPAPVLDGVMTDAEFGDAQVSVSAGGTLAYVPGSSSPEKRTLVMMDRSGAVQPITEIQQPYEDLALSPDGQKLALTIEGPTWNVWIYDLRAGTLSRFTFEGDNRDPLWTPDGKRLIYSTFRSGRWGLFWKPASGTGPEERLTTDESTPWANSWSPDGQLLAFCEPHVGTGQDIWLLPLAGDRKPRPLMQTRYTEWRAAFSPDGHWFAYVSDESGREEVYVQPFPGLNGKWQVSTDGGRTPVWGPEGRELFYRNGDKLMVIPIETKPAFSASKPQLLFEANYLDSGHDYAITPDGKHFVFIRPSAQQNAATQINVVLNWFEELNLHAKR